MTRVVEFTPLARPDLLDAFDRYETIRASLGQDFRSAVNVQARRIAETPLQFPVVFKSVRRALVRRFPYALYFQLYADAATVFACFHASRDPRAWQGRL